jgi:hypothetical protein
VKSKRRKFRKEEMSKRQKTIPTYTCCLFNIKLVEEDSVVVGDDRMWVWGLLAYCKTFDTWNSTLISQECKDEATRKSNLLTESKLAIALQECAPEQIQSHHSLTKQHFWIHILEKCANLIFSVMRLDSKTKCMLKDVLELYYYGFTYTFSWHPLLAIQFLCDLCDRIDEHLHGETFWTFNPVLLVQSCLWTTELHSPFITYVKKFHPSRHIPLSVELLQAANPVPLLKNVEEQTVSDQNQACAVAFGTTYHPPSVFNYMHVYTNANYPVQGFVIE